MPRSFFDVLTRQQIYVEGVKNWHNDDFNRYLKLIADAVRKFFAKLGVQTLGELNKSQLARLLKNITNRVGEVMGGYGNEFLDALKRFTYQTVRNQRVAYGVIATEKDIGGVGMSRVWSATKDRTVPAFGKTAREELIVLASVAKDKIRQRINTGHVDNEATAAVQADIVDLAPKSGSVLRAIGNSARSFISTAFQHAAATASSMINDVIEDCYQWCSIIDNRTTEVCRGRNGEVYRQGMGPQPPAHPFCRSHTVPVECGNKFPVPTLLKWLTTQSQAFLKDAFGGTFAGKVASGKLAADDIGPFGDFPAVSLDAYETKAPLLTA